MSSPSQGVSGRDDRVFAADLATRYAVLVLENVDLRAVARLPSVDAEETPDEDARSLRQLAAVSELRFALHHAFRARAGRVEGVPASSKQACHLCGSLESHDAAATRHACSGCGATRDPDQNACALLLGGWQETASRGGRRAHAPSSSDARRSQVDERAVGVGRAEDALRGGIESGEAVRNASA